MVKIAFALPVETFTVLPTPYAEPPSTISTAVIVPPALTVILAVPSLPAIYGLIKETLVLIPG